MTAKRKAQGGSPDKPVADAEQKRAEHNARVVKRLFDEEDLPEFITNAVMTALHEAEHRMEIQFWQVDEDNIMGDDFDMAGLTALLRAGYSRTDIEVEPVKDLAELISAVLKHPDTPADLSTPCVGR